MLSKPPAKSPPLRASRSEPRSKFVTPANISRDHCTHFPTTYRHHHTTQHPASDPGLSITPKQATTNRLSSDISDTQPSPRPSKHPTSHKPQITTPPDLAGLQWSCRQFASPGPRRVCCRPQPVARRPLSLLKAPSARLLGGHTQRRLSPPAQPVPVRGCTPPQRQATCSPLQAVAQQDQSSYRPSRRQTLTPSSSARITGSFPKKWLRLSSSTSTRGARSRHPIPRRSRRRS